MASDPNVELAAQVIAESIRRKLSIGTAESCTGGMVCAALTSVPGSSSVVRGSVVSYDPAVKRAILHVSHEVCDERHLGVVSQVCAAQMARGAAKALDCACSVSITGIAGPSGAEAGKPVGTVWFGVFSPNGTRCVRRLLPGNRASVRTEAVRVALQLLLEELNRIEPKK